MGTEGEAVDGDLGGQTSSSGLLGSRWNVVKRIPMWGRDSQGLFKGIFIYKGRNDSNEN